MARTGSDSTDPSPSRSWTGASLAAVAAVVLLAAYLAHELIGGFLFPVGPDGPVYTWWIRHADAAGLGAAAPARAGVPAGALVLQTALGTTAVQTVMLLGPVLAAAAGLAGGSLVEAAYRRGMLPTALLTGTFAAYLAGGWLANMAQAALFLGALACLVLAARSWRAAVAAAALLLASGLSHALFSLVGGAIIAGALALGARETFRAVRRGTPLRDIPAFRIAVATAAALALTWIGVLLLSAGPDIPGDTSQDGFFRRTGMVELLGDRYRERLAGDLSRMLLPLAAGAALAVGWAVAGRSPSHPEPAQGSLGRTLASWTVLTAAGVLFLTITLAGPPNRLLVFAFFIPLAAAAGGAMLLARGRPIVMAAVAVAVVAFGAVSMYGWYRQSPSFSPEELALATRAGRALEPLPPGTPVVFVLDTSEPAAAFHITRFANVIRMGLPPALIPSTRFVVGEPRDVVAGRVTVTGDPEHDRMARIYLQEAAEVLEDAWVLVAEPFNRDGFAQAAAEGDTVVPGLAVVGVPDGGSAAAAGGIAAPALRAPPPVDGRALGLSAPAVVALTLASLALLVVMGLGWARWGVPGASSLAALGLAPAAGLGICVLAGYAVDRIAPGAASPWGLPTALLVGGVGYLMARRRRG